MTCKAGDRLGGQSQVETRRTLILAVVAGAFFMEMLDGTVIGTALPSMAQAFGCTAEQLSGGITSYLVAVAVTIPLSGWVADRFGERAVFAGALAGFTAASVLCGLSLGFWSFCASRILQGAAGAMMFPVGRLAVLAQTPKADLLRAVAVLTWPGLVAPVLGPPLGGFLTTYADWRWIFFLNVPIGVAGCAITLAVFTDRAGQSACRRLDWAGFLFCAFGLAGLMVALALSAQPAPPVGLAMVGGASAALCLLLATRRMLDRRDGLLPIGVLRVRSFRTMLLGGGVLRAANACMPFLLPLLLQLAFRMSAFASGLLVLALFAGNLVMKLAAIGIVRRWGFRAVLTVASVAGSVSILSCLVLRQTSPMWLMAVVLFAVGLCRSLQLTAVNSLTFADVPEGGMSGASTLASLSEQLAAAIGVAFGAIALRIGSGGAAPGLGAFRLAFAMTAMLPLLALIDIRGLAHDAGQAVRGVPRPARTIIQKKRGQGTSG